MKIKFAEILEKKPLAFSLIFGIVFLVLGVLFPDLLKTSLGKLNSLILSVFSTYYLWVGFIVVLVSVALLFLPISKQKLGSEKPEYSFFSWIALLYSTGMGSGLLLRAVQEPVFYFKNPPVADINVKHLSLEFTYFHWGLTPWAMYSLFGLIIAYNLYIRKAHTLLEAIVFNHNKGLFFKIIPLFLVIITIEGVIASLGLGTAQFVGGLNQYFNLSLGNNVLIFIVFFIGLIGTLSALTGIQKAIKFLADFDMSVSIILMIFVAMFLNYTSFFSQSFTALYHYIIHFFEMSLSIGAYKTSESFIKDWTVFYWAFWLAWVPFTGVFIARISKGRCIREYIIATILVPTFATIVWFSVFANKVFDFVENNPTDEFDNVFTSIFVFFQHLPFSQITVFVAALLVLVSIINSVDSAIFVLGMFSDNGNENPSKKDKLLWGIVITATAVGLTAIGSNSLLNSISDLLIILALPFSVLYLYIIYSFLKSI